MVMTTMLMMAMATILRRPLREPFHLPTIWKENRGMKHVCVAACPRPMPVIHLEVGQQAVRSREWFDNNRLKALKWYPASARWRAWTFATHAPKGHSFAGPRNSYVCQSMYLSGA